MHAARHEVMVLYRALKFESVRMDWQHHRLCWWLNEPSPPPLGALWIHWLSAVSLYKGGPE